MIRNQLDLQTDKVNSIQVELDQKRCNFDAIKSELAQEKVALAAVKTDVDHQKSALDQEMACHTSTKRLVDGNVFFLLKPNHFIVDPFLSLEMITS